MTEQDQSPFPLGDGDPAVEIVTAVGGAITKTGDAAGTILEKGGAAIKKTGGRPQAILGLITLIAVVFLGLISLALVIVVGVSSCSQPTV